MSIKCFGTSVSVNASVEVIIRFLSNWIKGRLDGFEPVAIMIFVPVISCTLPSGFLMLIVFLSLNEPTPCMPSILFFFEQEIYAAGVFCNNLVLALHHLRHIQRQVIKVDPVRLEGMEAL